MKTLASLALVFAFCSTHAQRADDFTRVFQFSLVPGIGTNGLHPGAYTNYFSLNITSGYSSANYLIELAGISNLNEFETRGLQFAGIANITGGNAYAGLQEKEIEKKKREGFEANFSGAQFAGFANVVLNNVFGWQTAGGVNVAKGALQGLQLAGISNTVYKYSFAVQLAGLYNVSVESMDGVQAAGLFNITTGGLYGVQIGAFNRSGFMEGKNSYERDDPTAFQIGLVNTSGKMNGFQIGLINIGKRMQGTQIGLINFYTGGKMPQTKDGTSIGLLNLSSSGYLSVYVSDVFYGNVEIATGTIKNGRVSGDTWEKQIQNGLIYSRDPGFMKKSDRWAIGYALRKFYFRRSATPGMNKATFLAGGVEWLHVNHDRNQLTKEFSLLSRPVVTVGSKLSPKNKVCYFFASVAYNVYYSASGRKLDPLVRENAAGRFQHWPGFSGGVLVQ